jgi:NAD(P)-dependent dehydrogenase (short-subunit alcohol dehydrogenase family)
LKIEDLFSVKGQVAVVTAVASGLGLSFTGALAESGATVGVMGRNAAALDTESTHLQALGSRPGGSRRAARKAVVGPLRSARSQLDFERTSPHHRHSQAKSEP